MRQLTVAGPAVLLAFGVLVSAAGTVSAQPPPAEAERMHACVCLEQAMQATRATMTAKTHALAAVRANLADLDAQVERAREQVNVNDPQSIARFKALLERRDAVSQRATGPIVRDAQTSVARYNAEVARYNEECANRPYDPALEAQIRANLSCPPIR
jgi:hypothetical protein